MTPNELPQVVDLPPLPKPAWPSPVVRQAYYTADQMREYARTALSTLTAQGGDAVAWRLVSDGTVLFFPVEASCRAQAFELRKGGYPAVITPLYTTPPAPSRSAVEGLVMVDRKLLEVAVCPNAANGCDGEQYPVGDPHGDYHGEQCQFCYERKQALASTAASGRDDNPQCQVAKGVGCEWPECGCPRKAAPAMPEGMVMVQKSDAKRLAAYVLGIAGAGSHVYLSAKRVNELLAAASAQGDGWDYSTESVPYDKQSPTRSGEDA